MATPDTSLLWLSTSQAGAALGISARAVQKRCAAGTLVARRVPVPGGFKWEVDGRELDPGTPEPNRAEPRNLGDGTGELHAQISRNLGRNPGTGTPELTSEPDRELWAQREAELKAEVAFLRGVIEQLQRDGAETRQALKRALDLAPKQLTAGDGSTNLIEAPQRAPNGAVGKDSPANTNGAQKPAKRPEATATGETEWNNVFANLADQLEEQNTG